MSFLKRLSPLQKAGLGTAAALLAVNIQQNAKPNVVVSTTEDASLYAQCKIDGKAGSIATKNSDVLFRAQGVKDADPAVAVVKYVAGETKIAVGFISDMEGDFKTAAQEAREVCNNAIGVARENSMRRGAALEVGRTIYSTRRVWSPDRFVAGS